MRDFWRYLENTPNGNPREGLNLTNYYEFSQTLPDQISQFRPNFTILEYLDYLELGPFRNFCDVFFNFLGPRGPPRLFSFSVPDYHSVSDDEMMIPFGDAFVFPKHLKKVSASTFDEVCPHLPFYFLIWSARRTIYFLIWSPQWTLSLIYFPIFLDLAFFNQSTNFIHYALCLPKHWSNWIENVVLCSSMLNI